jgi:hypothetical protein
VPFLSFDDIIAEEVFAGSLIESGFICDDGKRPTFPSFDVPDQHHESGWSPGVGLADILLTIFFVIEGRVREYAEHGRVTLTANIGNGSILIER